MNDDYLYFFLEGEFVAVLILLVVLELDKFREELKLFFSSLPEYICCEVRFASLSGCSLTVVFLVLAVFDACSGSGFLESISF